MTQKHTPGPWLVHTSEYGSYIECKAGYPICGNLNDRPDGFNAHLIAAAPDLYRALELILNSDMDMREEDEGEISTVLSIARAAIAKAEGK